MYSRKWEGALLLNSCSVLSHAFLEKCYESSLCCGFLKSKALPRP
jgi:hypothetical protein